MKKNVASQYFLQSFYVSNGLTITKLSTVRTHFLS